MHPDAFSDLAGNKNLEASNTFEWNSDTTAPSVHILISGRDTRFFNEDQLEFILTSEACDDFTNDTLIVNGGYVSRLINESRTRFIGTWCSSAKREFHY